MSCFQDVVLKLLCKNPVDRFASPAELLKELSRIGQFDRSRSTSLITTIAPREVAVVAKPYWLSTGMHCMSAQGGEGYFARSRKIILSSLRM